MNVSALLPQAHQPARPKNVVTSNGKGCDICGDNARFVRKCKRCVRLRVLTWQDSRRTSRRWRGNMLVRVSLLRCCGAGISGSSSVVPRARGLSHGPWRGRWIGQAVSGPRRRSGAGGCVVRDGVGGVGGPLRLPEVGGVPDGAPVAGAPEPRSPRRVAHMADSVPPGSLLRARPPDPAASRRRHRPSHGAGPPRFVLCA